MLSMRARFERITDSLHQAIMHYELGTMSGTLDQKAVEKATVTLEDAHAKLTALLTPAPASKGLSTAERITTLVGGLAPLARAKRALLVRADALHTLLVTHLTGDAAAYWTNNGGEMAGWISDPKQPVVRDELAKLGVLAWRNQTDEHFRLIDANYLEAHADIRAHVAKEWEGGRRCRFCEMTELPTSLELIAVGPGKRKPLDTINGVVVLQLGEVYVHERCAPHWERWRGIAESYKTQEEAIEADRVAGRVSRVPPDVPAEPEPERATRYITGNTAAEQYR